MTFPLPLAVHCFECNGHKIVYDVNTCFFFEAEDVTWNVLNLAPHEQADDILARLSDQYGPQRVEFALNLVSGLVDQRLLSRQDQAEPARVRLFPLRFLFLSISHDCNMRCRYCYAEAGAYYGQRGMMTPEVARRSVEFLYRNGERGASNYVIRYFGGEPVMNWPVIQETINHSKKLADVYNIPTVHELLTNATLLTPDRLNYCIDNDVHLVVSVDGPPDIHDAMRRMVDGGGSYELVASRLGEALASQRVVAAARPTLRPDHADFVRVVQHLFDMGFTFLSPEPMWRTPEGNYGWTDQDVPLLKEQMAQLGYWYLDKIMNGEMRYSALRPFAYLMRAAGTTELAVADTYCGAAKQMVSIDYQGDIYPCFRFFSVPEFKMGNVAQDGLDPTVQEQFVRTRYPFIPECNACWAHSLCGGVGCPAEAYFMNGAINRPHRPFCEVYRHAFELGMMIYCALRQENPRVLRLFTRVKGYTVDGRSNISGADQALDKVTVSSRGMRL